MSRPSDNSLSVVGISGSPSASSRSAGLLDRALACLEGEGARTERIVLSELSAPELLGRTSGPDLEVALRAVETADIVVASTPVYRATYSGLLKVFFDLMPRQGLAGKIGVPLATGSVAEHGGVLSDVARLFESLGARVVTGAYGLDTDFVNDRFDGSLAERVDRAAREASEILRTRPRLPMDQTTTATGDPRHVVP